MPAFPDLKTARLALLGEPCEVANSLGLEFAVCGGWSPYLRNPSPIRHPGTKDVDLLFADGVKIGGLKDAFNAFREAGFLPSAKHEFQLIRVYDVTGVRLAFNVDLLHPTEGKVSNDMFVDHVELPVLEDQAAIARLTGKSIAAPHSKFVFSGFTETEEIKFVDMNGAVRSVKVPLIDEIGVLVTKSESCLVKKRPRDLFDIYLAIAQPQHVESFAARLTLLRETHPEAFHLLVNIRKACDCEMGSEQQRLFEEAGVRPRDAQAKIIEFLNPKKL